MNQATDEQLLARHWAAVHSYARLCTSSTQYAGMLTTAAFTRTFGEFGRRPGETVAWLPRLLVAVRGIAAEWDADQRRSQLHPDLHSGPGDGDRASVRLLPPENRLLVSRAFKELQETARGILWHAEVEAEDLAIPAELLGLTAADAPAQLERARELLRTATLEAHTTLAPREECRRYNRLLDASVRQGGAKTSRDVLRHMNKCGYCRYAADQLDQTGGRLPVLLAEAVLGWGARPYLDSRPGRRARIEQAQAGPVAAEAPMGPFAARPSRDPIEERPPRSPITERPLRGPIAERPPRGPIAERLPKGPIPEEPPTGPFPEKPSTAPLVEEAPPGPVVSVASGESWTAPPQAEPWPTAPADESWTSGPVNEPWPAAPEAESWPTAPAGESWPTAPADESWTGPANEPWPTGPDDVAYHHEPGIPTHPDDLSTYPDVPPPPPYPPKPGRRPRGRRTLALAVLAVSACVAVPLILWAGDSDDPQPPSDAGTGSASKAPGSKPPGSKAPESRDTGAGPSRAGSGGASGEDDPPSRTTRGQLRNVGNDLCVGIEGGKAVKGAEAVLTACTTSALQQWSYEEDGLLRSLDTPELCLDSRLASSVRLGACEGEEQLNTKNVRYDFTGGDQLLPLARKELALTPAAEEGESALVLKVRDDSASQRWQFETSVTSLQMEWINAHTDGDTDGGTGGESPEPTHSARPSPGRTP